MELPKEFKGTIYFYFNTEYNWLSVSDAYLNNHNYILLGTVEVDVEFTIGHDEAVNKMVSNLKNQKQTIQAETQQKLNQIDDKINSLLAITYQGDDK